MRLAFPLRMTSFSKGYVVSHRQIGELGPNDGAILLYDTLRAPGVVYPVRGADHYMRPRFRVEPLCRGLLRYAAGELPSKEIT